MILFIQEVGKMKIVGAKLMISKFEKFKELMNEDSYKESDEE